MQRSRAARSASPPLLATALLAIVAVAAALRFFHLGHQSFWLDESFTVGVVGHGLGHVFTQLSATESTPPLYYLLAWLWSQVFGTGELGLRALSAVFGIATVPVCYLIGRELFSARAGLIAAALVAVNPYFIWYSQEARSYALLVLLAALSLLQLIRALREPSGRRLAGWALVAVLALCTHYFAAFIVLPEGLWLVWSLRRRGALLAVAAPVLAAAALAPLALHQHSTGHTAFISQFPLKTRIANLARNFVTGELGLPLPVVGTLAGLLVAAGLVLAVRPTAQRRPASLMIALAAAAALVPLVLAVAGVDYLLTRNLIAFYVPLAVAVAAGFASLPTPAAAAAATGALCLTALLVDGYVASDASLQRDDWRGAAHALGPVRAERAIVLTPDVGTTPLAHYAGALRAFPAAGAAVTEVDLIGNARPAHFPTPPAPAGFTLAFAKDTPSYELLRFTAPAPVPVTAAVLARSKLGSKRAATFVQGP